MCAPPGFSHPGDLLEHAVGGEHVLDHVLSDEQVE